MKSRCSSLWHFDDEFEMLCVEAYSQIENHKLATACKEPTTAQHQDKIRRAFQKLFDCIALRRDWQAIAIRSVIFDLLNKKRYSHKQLAKVHAELQRAVLNYLPL